MPSDTPPRRILLVDDEDDIAVSLAAGLRLAFDDATEVEVAHSAAEAKARLARERFDVVLSDERMPGMRGSELLAWLRWEQPEVRRALMSAYPDSFDGKLARRAGAHVMIPKPLDARAVAGALRAALRESEGGMPPANP